MIVVGSSEQPLTRALADWHGLLLPCLQVLSAECLTQFRRFDRLFQTADHRCRLVYGPGLAQDFPLTEVATGNKQLPLTALHENGQQVFLDRVFLRYKTRNLLAKPSEFGLYEEVGLHFLRIHYEVHYLATTATGRLAEQRHSFTYNEGPSPEFCAQVARQLWRNLAAVLELHAGSSSA